jgi:hypothetical protein
VDGWIDFNQDGDWTDPGEQIIDTFIFGGTTTFLFFIPDTVPTGTTYARFRLSGKDNLTPDGAAPNGEVEDYQITILDPDYGDAPDASGDFGESPYPTLRESSGARHGITSGFHLGPVSPGVDGETDGQPNSGATGDDSIGLDDEDGVTFVTPLVPGAMATFEVTLTNTAVLADPRLNLVRSVRTHIHQSGSLSRNDLSDVHGSLLCCSKQ